MSEMEIRRKRDSERNLKSLKTNFGMLNNTKVTVQKLVLT